MKQFSFLLAMALLLAPASVRSQDAATEERLNKLSAQIQDLADARDAQNKKLGELARAVEALQQQLNKPNANYASQEDLKLLADKVQEVDRKRQEDGERILKGVQSELKGLASTLKKPGSTAATATAADTTSVSDKGYEYIIKPGDTLSVIVAAYKEQKINVSIDDILKANPGLDPKRMSVGKKIFIPAPK